MINEDIRHIVEGELHSGEKLLWADKPMKLPLNGMAIMMCLISGLFVLIGLVVLLNMVFFSEQGGGFVIGFMLLWTSIAGWNLYYGINMIRGPYLNVFGITNQRVIIIDRIGSGRVASLNPTQLGQAERSGDDFIGTLQFGRPASIFEMQGFKKLPLNSLHKTLERSKISFARPS